METWNATLVVHKISKLFHQNKNGVQSRRSFEAEREPKEV